MGYAIKCKKTIDARSTRYNKSDEKSVKPFLKWAGGKSQLLEVIREKYPSAIEKYCEPFVGGGAVLLDVLANFQPKERLKNVQIKCGDYSECADFIDENDELFEYLLSA